MVLKLCGWIVRGLLKLRYRITVKGAVPPHDGGILFLPNHPAEVDPVILFCVLGKHFSLRPLVLEKFYYMRGLNALFRKLGAIPVPDFNGMVNLWKQKKVNKALALVGKSLQMGENFLIYPSGRLKHTAEEVVGGASMVHSLIEQFPQTQVVLIRTTGLWGSRFSRAITGSSPDFGTVVWEAFKIVLKNGFFFVPKRDVVIEIEPAPADFPRKSSRLDFNHYLEKWYNAPHLEPLKLVSERFWKWAPPLVTAQTEEREKEVSWTMSPAVEKEIFNKIGQIAKRSDISRAQHLEKDLGLDSLDLAQLGLFLEGRFELEEVPLSEVQTVEDALRVVALAVKPKAFFKSKVTWPEEPGRPPGLSPEKKTVHECFLHRCHAMSSYAACADQVLGVMSYAKMKKIVFILSRRLSSFEESHIGILLPSLSMTYILILATLLAGKIPVMLNWTVGKRALDHCRTTAGLKTILSSRRFLDNLSNVDLGDIEDSLVLLEDLKDSISLKDKLAGLWDALRSKVKACDEHQTAVILFTSGTEALPKGVPLSHRNILANHRSAIESVDIVSSDVFYGVLPPFHSFGFSVTGLLPLLAGIKVIYAPDPTHYHAMAQDIAQWKVTFFCAAPTFILGVFRGASPEQLMSLRYIVAGAETTPQELFELIQSYGKELLQGYGITECAPVVTLTRPQKSHQGVGQPLPGIELCTVDETSQSLLSEGKEGEICICGPNVFAGYLDPKKNPFIELQGKRWYLSGDRGYMTPEGCLILSGRLKRFIKIGGEMISLGGLEEELSRYYKSKSSSTPPLAVVAEEDGKPQIILFTTFPLTREEVNQFLLEKGYSRLIKVSKVVQVDQIPVTGTGKIQYSALHATL
jgi:acyl-CoA synthetase (AMP-forming)/AMP-acid ligase II/1-acyl-sn-glycerol-3-phosphate acyltransferase/acyl carrier protein